MILQNIIAVLNADGPLDALVHGNIFPYSAPVDAIPCVIFSFSPISDNRVTRTDKLEIRVISADLQTMFDVDKRVRQLILTMGDGSYISGILQASINGGGSIEDIATGLTHQFTFYQITSRSDI